jgi:hypothetical protein
MARPATLRAVHHAAETLFDDILDTIETYGGAADAAPLCLKLAGLARILRELFVRQQRTLTKIIGTGDRQSAIEARICLSEQGEVGKSFEHFIHRWVDRVAIAGAVRQFRFEAGMMFAEIRDLIRRERSAPFAFAEQLLGGPQAWAPVPAPASFRSAFVFGLRLPPSRRATFDSNQPRRSSAAAASSASSRMISATGSSRVTMPTDWPAMTDPLSTSPSITARRSAPAQ